MNTSEKPSLAEIYARLAERVDFELVPDGESSLLRPKSERAAQWLREQGGTFVVEARDIERMASAILNAGMSIEYRWGRIRQITSPTKH